jgi:hypothetical protein
VTRVDVAGRGIAALTCGRLLASFGHTVVYRDAPERNPRPRWLVLPGNVADLLRAVWRLDDDPFVDALPLRGRQMRWGEGAPTVTVDARGLAVDGEQVVARLARATDSARDACPEARWVIVAGPPDPTSVLTSGRRCALTAEAPLRSDADMCVTRMRTSADAWVHLTPLPGRRALVQVMVPGPVGHPDRMLAEQLARTGLDAELAGPPARATVVQASPRLHLMTGRESTLPVGTTAIRQDPISGSGALQAVRTAVLAALAVDAIERGEPEDDVLRSYRAQLNATFHTHLRHCVRLYRAAFAGADWQDEQHRDARALRSISAVSREHHRASDVDHPSDGRLGDAVSVGKA